MPFKSMKQMRYMYANHPKIASRWSKEEKEGKGMGKSKKVLSDHRRRVLMGK